MPGGWAHWPLWAPYKWYGEVDGMYGFKAWNARNGFTAAQTVLNVVETAMYAVYLALWMRHGRVRAAGRKYVTGREGAIAPLLGFTAAVMTLSKTVLYCACRASAPLSHGEGGRGPCGGPMLMDASCRSSERGLFGLR